MWRHAPPYYPETTSSSPSSSGDANEPPTNYYRRITRMIICVIGNKIYLSPSNFYDIYLGYYNTLFSRGTGFATDALNQRGLHRCAMNEFLHLGIPFRAQRSLCRHRIFRFMIVICTFCTSRKLRIGTRGVGSDVLSSLYTYFTITIEV